MESSFKRNKLITIAGDTSVPLLSQLSYGSLYYITAEVGWKLWIAHVKADHQEVTC